MQPTFTQEERDVVIKLVTDVKINVLDQNAVGFVQILQSIAIKVFMLAPPAAPASVEKSAPLEKPEAPVKKSGKKTDPSKNHDPLSF